ncbi:MAG TPA: Do family serine endopeptidase [Candidatus Binataceae bacterium]|nr:Do family serine endopeptidase [Candidatus Binataceae bacterium]
MNLSIRSSLVFAGVSAAIALCAGAAVALAAGVADAGQLWRELPAAARQTAPAETLPDFVSLAATLGPTVVNIATLQSDSGSSADNDSAGGGNDNDDDEGQGGEPLDPFDVPRGRSLGSGFVINPAGYILTNDHVVENGRDIIVTTKDGEQYKAVVVGRDAKTDIALLHIDAGRQLPVAPLGDSNQVRVGEWVMAIGDPFGFDHTVTAGIVSAKGRFIPGNYDDFIQTDASINPGNSGGPLIDTRGEVIGVNSAIFTRTGASMGIGFAVPVNLVKEELGQLKESGRVVRGWLGVYVQQVTPAIAESMGLGQPRGALVAEVLSNGPAKGSGLERGDVIIAFDAQPIDDSRELPLIVGRAPLGHQAVVDVIRNRQPRELKVMISASQGEEIASVSRNTHQRAVPMGLTVKDLNPRLAHDLGLSDSKGVVVFSVEPGSSADDAGLKARDIILEVNRQAVSNVAAYLHALRARGTGKVVLLLVKRDNNTVFVPLEPEG